MDGIHPQKKRLQTKHKTAAAEACKLNLASSNGLPSAPGAELDSEVVCQTLAVNTTFSSYRQQHVPHNELSNGRSTNNASGNESATIVSKVTQQPFDAYVVLDFEATCEESKRIKDPEVIEFPMVLIDATTAQPVAEFQRYVKPVRRPQLSAFCTKLTGITQGMVERRSTFPEVYREALNFLAHAGLGDAPPRRSYCVVTCGDWDLNVMLPAQMTISGQLGVPPSFQKWCNLKKFMGRLNLPANTNGGYSRGKTPSGMPEMLRMMGLPLQGRHHSGIDDCRNIAAVLCALLKRGYVVDTTSECLAFTSGGQLQSKRWHAPLQQPRGAPPLPALTSLTSTLADGSTTTERMAEDRPPPRRQVRRETPASLPPSSGSAAAPSPSSRRILNVDTSRDAVGELLHNMSGGAAGFSAWEYRAISVFLSKLLRHRADQWKVPISANGYVLVDDVLRQPQIAQKHLTSQDLAVLVRDSDKQRFRLAFGADDGRLYISAAQGHSLSGVVPELRSLTKPEEVPVAVHGTYWNAWELIQACGYISTMTRQHIHFAKGLVHDSGVISGMRKDVQIFIYLNVSAVLADGIALYESSNGVILTPGVGNTRQLPLKYVAKVVVRDDGRTIYPVDK